MQGNRPQKPRTKSIDTATRQIESVKSVAWTHRVPKLVCRVHLSLKLLHLKNDTRSFRHHRGKHAPAFCSWTVSSVQLPFMRSRRAIHRSACSWSGMPSHRFSMLARVGLEMTWAADEA